MDEEFIMSEGTILRRKCPFPLITHVGILLYDDGKPVVYHNTAIKKNEYGGNIVAMPLAEFLALGDLISTTPSNVNPAFVRAYAFEMRHKKYSALFYNCEDFVNILTIGKKGSGQRRKWLFRAGLGATFYAFRQRRRNSA